MKLSSLMYDLKLEKAYEFADDPDIVDGYVSDLLSDVIGKAEADSIWFTIQKHPNIVAVASLKELSAVILTSDSKPDEETVIKAKENSIPLLITPFPTFKAAGILYSLLANKK